MLMDIDIKYRYRYSEARILACTYPRLHAYMQDTGCLRSSVLPSRKVHVGCNILFYTVLLYLE